MEVACSARSVPSAPVGLTVSGGNDGSRQLRRVSCIVVTLCLFPTLALAEAPKIDRVFPLGARRGETAELTLAGKSGGSLRAWSDNAGLSFKFSEKSDKVAVTISGDALPGRCLLRFYNSDGASKLFPFLVGTLAEASEVEPNDVAAQPQKLAGNAVVNGVLAKAGDVDVYSVPLKKDETFIASMNAHRLGAPMDGVLQLLDSSGAVLVQNDEGNGFDPQIVFRIPRDGDYLVRTFAFPSTPNSSIRFSGAATYAYRLTLTCGAFVDHTMPLVVEAGKPQSVRAVGWNIARDTVLQPVETAGPQVRAIAGSFANSVEVGTVRHQSLVETTKPPGEAFALRFTMSGTIMTAGEVDTFPFNASKGSLEVSVAAQSVHSLLDPVVVVRSKDGKFVKEADDISRTDRDIRTTIKLPTDGQYEASVSDRFGHGGLRYVYALSCSPVVPTFSATVAADAFVLKKGIPLKIPVSITRENGFDEAITVSMIGLPPGVTATPQQSAAKGPTAKKVEVIVTCDGSKASSGLIQVRCTPTTSQSRLVTYALPNIEARTTGLWLTVHPASKP